MSGGIAQQNSPLVSPVTNVTSDAIQSLSRLTIAQKEARLQKAQLDLEEAKLKAQKEHFQQTMQSQEADRQAQIQTAQMQIEAASARQQQELDFRKSQNEMEQQEAWKRMEAGFRQTMAINEMNFRREQEMAIARNASAQELQELEDKHRAETAALEANLATLTALVQTVDNLTLDQVNQLTKSLTDQAKVREEQLQAAATGALAGVNASTAVPQLIRSIHNRLSGAVADQDKALATTMEAILISRMFSDALRAATITIGRDAMLDVSGSVEQAILDIESLLHHSITSSGFASQNRELFQQTVNRLVEVTGGLLDEHAINSIMHTILLDMAALKQETAAAAESERREQADRSLWGQIVSLGGLTDSNSMQKARVVQQELEGLWRKVDRTIRQAFNPANMTRSPEALRNMADVLSVKALRPNITHEELVQSPEFQNLIRINKATIQEGLTGLAAKVQERQEAREKLQKAQTETRSRIEQMESERRTRRQDIQKSLQDRVRSLSTLKPSAD